MSLSAALIRILDEYPSAREEAFRAHPLARFIRHTLAQEVGGIVGDDARYLVEASAGKGNWARVPWVAVLDRTITQSAQDGYYVVILVPEDFAGVFLSLNQGVTTVRSQYASEAPKALRTRAADYLARLGPQAATFETGSIDLGAAGNASLAALYEQGSICHRYFPRISLNDASLTHDLKALLGVYFALVIREDLGTTEGAKEPDEVGLGAEDFQRLRTHKRLERNGTLAKAAKAFHGDTCQACGFNFREKYGDLGRGYIEAHHLTPVAALKGAKVSLDPKSDFAVLCANCHRMIHRTDLFGNVPEFTKQYILR